MPAKKSGTSLSPGSAGVMQIVVGKSSDEKQTSVSPQQVGLSSSSPSKSHSATLGRNSNRSSPIRPLTYSPNNSQPASNEQVAPNSRSNKSGNEQSGFLSVHGQNTATASGSPTAGSPGTKSGSSPARHGNGTSDRNNGGQSIFGAHRHSPVQSSPYFRVADHGLVLEEARFMDGTTLATTCVISKVTASAPSGLHAALLPGDVLLQVNGKNVYRLAAQKLAEILDNVNLQYVAVARGQYANKLLQNGLRTWESVQDGVIHVHANMETNHGVSGRPGHPVDTSAHPTSISPPRHKLNLPTVNISSLSSAKLSPQRNSGGATVSSVDEHTVQADPDSNLDQPTDSSKGDDSRKDRKVANLVIPGAQYQDESTLRQQSPALLGAWGGPESRDRRLLSRGLIGSPFSIQNMTFSPLAGAVQPSSTLSTPQAAPEASLQEQAEEEPAFPTPVSAPSVKVRNSKSGAEIVSAGQSRSAAKRRTEADAPSQSIANSIMRSRRSKSAEPTLAHSANAAMFSMGSVEKLTGPLVRQDLSGKSEHEIAAALSVGLVPWVSHVAPPKAPLHAARRPGNSQGGMDWASKVSNIDQSGRLKASRINKAVLAPWKTFDHEAPSRHATEGQQRKGYSGWKLTPLGGSGKRMAQRVGPDSGSFQSQLQIQGAKGISGQRIHSPNRAKQTPVWQQQQHYAIDDGQTGTAASAAAWLSASTSYGTHQLRNDQHQLLSSKGRVDTALRQSQADGVEAYVEYLRLKSQQNVL